MPLLLALLLASPESATRRAENLASRDWHAVVVALRAQTRPPVAPFKYLTINDWTDLYWCYGWSYDWEESDSWFVGSYYFGKVMTGRNVRLNGGFPEVLRLVPGVIVR